MAAGSAGAPNSAMNAAAGAASWSTNAGAGGALGSAGAAEDAGGPGQSNGSAAGAAAAVGGAPNNVAGGAPAAGAPSGGDPSARCMAFCAQEGTLCSGPNAAYPSLQVCLITCASFAPGDATNTGNTLACRVAHLNSVSTLGVSQCAQTGAVSKASFDDTSATGACN